MNKQKLKGISDNLFQIRGSIDFYSASEIWKELEQKIFSLKKLTISFRNVNVVNSAALALILEAQDQASQRGVEITFVDIPEKIRRLAELSNVSDLIFSQ
tara:strand:+ start:10300 stop:10599 length:300 start_codon:yes stop_codon:yes gene_type:complete